MVPEIGGRAGRSSPRILQGATNSEESGNFGPRKLLLGADIGFADRIRGAGQERDSPTLSGAARRPGKYLCPLSKAHQNARAANGTGGEDGPKLAAVRHLLSDRRGSEPRCPPVLGTRSRFIESGRCRGDGRRAHPWGQHNQLRGISELRHSKITGSTRRPPRRPD
jgi:hypothetical protein